MTKHKSYLEGIVNDYQTEDELEDEMEFGTPDEDEVTQVDV